MKSRESAAAAATAAVRGPLCNPARSRGRGRPASSVGSARSVRWRTMAAWGEAAAL